MSKMSQAGIDAWNEKPFSEYGLKYNHLKYLLA
jgi:hypothetical protein